MADCCCRVAISELILEISGPTLVVARNTKSGEAPIGSKLMADSSEVIFSHLLGGSVKKKWGPKTRSALTSAGRPLPDVVAQYQSQRFPAF